jgi:hypothetical protein
MKTGLSIAALLLGLASLVYAVESTLRDLHRETSEIREFSIKPLVVYSARGRRDPFVAPLVSSITADNSTLRITELRLTGVLRTDHQSVAMFGTWSGREATYTLRSGKLFGPDGLAVPNISGKILNGSVVLKQGNESLSFAVSH